MKILKELGLDNWVRDYQEFDSKEAFTSGEAEEPNLDQEKDDEEVSDLVLFSSKTPIGKIWF